MNQTKQANARMQMYNREMREKEETKNNASEIEQKKVNLESPSRFTAFFTVFFFTLLIDDFYILRYGFVRSKLLLNVH